MDSDLSAAYALQRVGHCGLSGKQVVVGHRDIVRRGDTSGRSLAFGKPCRITQSQTGPWRGGVGQGAKARACPYVTLSFIGLLTPHRWIPPSGSLPPTSRQPQH